MKANPDNLITREAMLVAARTRRQGRKSGKRITSGSVTVRVFPVHEQGRPTRYEARFWSGGRIVRRKFTTREKAETFAREQAAALAAGQQIGRGLTAEQAAFTVAVIERGEKYQQATGDTRFPIVIIDEQMSQGERAHAAGLTLPEAVTLGIRHSPRAFVERAVPDLVKDFLEDVRARSVAQASSLAHWRSLRSRLGVFAAAFTGPIATLDRRVVQEWLTGRNVPAKTWNHFRAAILQLARFAVKQGHAGGELVQNLATLTTYRVRARKPSPYTPAELEALLTRAVAKAPEIVPYIVAVAFCGFRSSEVVSERGSADWADFDFDRGEAKVWAGHSKVSEDRFAALLANAVAWLRPRAQASGPICPVMDPDQVLRRVRRGSEIPAKRNGLRAGFISHRLAVLCDIVKVADEAGTSPEKIKSNYLSRPPQRDGEAWFAIRPAAPASPSRPHSP